MKSYHIAQHAWGRPELSPGLAWPQKWPNATAIFADPPYNQGVQYADDPLKDRVDPTTYEILTANWIFDLSQYLVPGGTLWWLVPERHADFVGPLLTKMVGPRVHRVIFEESFAQYQQRKLTEDYRMLFCHTNDPEGRLLRFNPDAIREPSVRQEMGDTRADPRGRVPGQIWKMRRLQGTSRDRVDWHPTQLPPELIRRIVRGWTNEGDVFLDAFAGSGVSGEVALAEKRLVVLVDQSPTYCEKMRQRLESQK